MITNDQKQRIIMLAHDFATAMADASNATLLQQEEAREMRAQSRVAEHKLHEFLGSITGTPPLLLGYVTQHSIDKMANSGSGPGNEGLAIHVKPHRKLMTMCGIYYIKAEKK